MTAIIDYGAGNLQSVRNALDFLGSPSAVTADPDEIRKADRVILPGVGAFGDAMERLKASGLDEAVKEFIKAGKPFLGICLGMQLLFESSEESPGVEGLGVIRGGFVKIPKADGIKIPHMGWNSITAVKENRLLKGTGNEPFVYFVHSYYMQCAEPDAVLAYTEYGRRLDIAVERDNVFATQFHPEKSGETGMTILKNFLRM